MISAVGTLSTRTSRDPCQQTARISALPRWRARGRAAIASADGHLPRLHALLEPAEVFAHLTIDTHMEERAHGTAEMTNRRVPQDHAYLRASIAGRGCERHRAGVVHVGAIEGSPGDETPGLIG